MLNLFISVFRNHAKLPIYGLAILFYYIFIDCNKSMDIDYILPYNQLIRKRPILTYPLLFRRYV